MTDRVHEEACSLLAKADQQHRDEQARVALGWTVITRDQNDGNIEVWGIFTSEREALVFSVLHHEEIHRGMEGEPGWDVDVRPILPSTEEGWIPKNS